jgi:glycosyltransferase involved in cell wall biosynthesis
MRILLVEPYYGGSHQAWADGYTAASRHDVTVVTHEAQFWKWRMQGAHLTLASEAAAALSDPPDVVLASSMMNVAAFAGAARHTTADAPFAVYFHESQFTYPLSPLDRADATYPMLNWSSAAAADLALFNSEFHRTTFIEGARAFLRQFPDRRHDALVDSVEQRSIVLPVGIDVGRFMPRRRDDPPLIVWNQRWEHDKGPEALVRLLEALVLAGAAFRVAIVGERFVSSPAVFDGLPDLLGDRLVAFGFLGDDDYAELLAGADIVVSTALQEFFGVAVIEAIAAGAFPVLPDRLVYPEHIPVEHRGRCLYDSEEGLADRVRWALETPGEAAVIAAELAERMAGFDWSRVAPRYDTALAKLVV